jgi:streptogramin lyase
MGITVGPDGALWFLECSANNVGRIDPTTHAITEYPIPTRNSGACHGITSGPDGALWFTEGSATGDGGGADKIGRIDPKTHVITEYSPPTRKSGPAYITSGSDGALWFTEGGDYNTVSRIGRIDPITHHISEYPTDGYADPWGITGGPDGALWFTEASAGSIGRINPTTHVITSYPEGDGTPPGSITCGADGNLWFSLHAANQIGSIKPASHDTADYSIPTSNSNPNNITGGPDHAVWFTELNTSKIGRLDLTTHAMAEYAVPTSNSYPVGITNGPDGALWFTEAYGNKIGRITTPPAIPVWTITGSLLHARSRHTATLLTNGKVLVAGGDVVDWRHCELYDPSTGKWTATGSLNIGRYGHTATLLTNGKVLVAAGIGIVGTSPIPTVLSSCELYDPSTGTWTLTGSLKITRSDHTATLLQNGKVLVAAGYQSYNPQTAFYFYPTLCELYNPSSGTWTTTGSLNVARDAPTATLLKNGQALLAGGYDYNNNDNLSNCELYNPSTGTWTVTGSLNSGRFGHTATLLQNGMVLAAAGTGLVGTSTITALSSCELYDPSTGAWTETGSLSTARDTHTATLLPSHKVLVAGGDQQNYDLSSCELYDPSSGEWTAASSLHTARVWHTATLLKNGKPLVAGGEQAATSTNLSSCEIFGIPPAPTAGFTAKPTSGTAPLKVQFSDASSGGPTSWTWNFGDGTRGFSASSCPVVHIFNKPGTFTVELTAGNAGGSTSKSTVIVVK